MGRELTQSEDESRQATNRFTVLQERFDSQTTMLRLTKEHNGDLQERLLSSEAVNAAKLEANEGKYKTENAVLAEQRSTLQRQVEELKTQLANLQTSSSKFKSDIETTLEELKTDKVTLMEQNTRLEGNLDHLRGDCATLECQRADLQREKKALQEALEKGSEEVLKLRNLVENYDKAATLQLRNAIERVDGHITALTGASLTEQEHSNKLLETECKRADFAEKSFEHASVQIHELKMELSTLGAELKATKDAAVIVQEELTRAQAVEGQMKTTLARIEALESENECLRKMENTMQERYQTGELTNSEKELVSLVMKTTQTMHEQEIVEKENELRRKDNMVGAMQAKIDALESTLAKCLKNQDHDQTGQSKSMVDLNIWMSSSPLSTSSGPASQTRSSVIVNRRLITDNPGRMASRPESPTFAQLEAGENRSGSEDKLPDLEPTRPTKKPKLSSARKVEVGDETKPKRGNARKRRN
ncbi:hypothetical protein L218DRAFT_614630 [Marasmius fiardii PR-910]|nr:hypothetical protein L218DRAFT_614630 [Marasmius fiardii PR-910]